MRYNPHTSATLCMDKRLPFNEFSAISLLLSRPKVPQTEKSRDERVDIMFCLFYSSYIPWYSAWHIVGTREIYDQVMDCRY